MSSNNFQSADNTSPPTEPTHWLIPEYDVQTRDSVLPRSTIAGTPGRFVQKLWLRCHRPELFASPDSILLTDRGELCTFEEWASPGIPRLKILSHDFYCEVPGLPLSAVGPDGSPRSIVAVLYENAEILVRAAVSIQSFCE